MKSSSYISSLLAALIVILPSVAYAGESVAKIVANPPVSADQLNRCNEKKTEGKKFQNVDLDSNLEKVTVADEGFTDPLWWARLAFGESINSTTPFAIDLNVQPSVHTDEIWQVGYVQDLTLKDGTTIRYQGHGESIAFGSRPHREALAQYFNVMEGKTTIPNFTVEDLQDDFRLEDIARIIAPFPETTKVIYIASDFEHIQKTPGKFEYTVDGVPKDFSEHALDANSCFAESYSCLPCLLLIPRLIDRMKTMADSRLIFLRLPKYWNSEDKSEISIINTAIELGEGLEAGYIPFVLVHHNGQWIRRKATDAFLNQFLSATLKE